MPAGHRNLYIISSYGNSNMDVIDAIENRRSVRHFLDKHVEWPKIVQIIEAATKAPSAGNKQTFRFIVVDERDKINKLADACFQQSFITEAEYVIVVVSAFESLTAMYGERGEQLYAIQECAAATQNLLLAATALGLGTCWVSAFDEGRVKDILEIKRARPMGVIPIGYASGKVEVPSKHDISTFVYFNKFGQRIKDIEKSTKDYAQHVENKVVPDLKKRARRFLNRVKSKGK